MAPSESGRRDHKLIRQAALLVLVAAALVGIYALASNVPSIRNAVTLATTKKPEAFTELYFEDHDDLPKVVERYRNYSFAFTVHNVEHRETEYPYIVYLQTDRDEMIFDSGTLRLKADEYQSRNEDFVLVENTRTHIVVELTDKNQEIAFWMERQ
jgi:hypothetical protein